MPSNPEQPHNDTAGVRHQIRPPPLRQHLAELRTRRDAWWILARNAVPVVGVYALGWSGAVTILCWWADGLAGIGAILAALLPRTMAESKQLGPNPGPIRKVASYALTWLFLFAIVGMPYWFALFPLGGLGLLEAALPAFAASPALWLSLATMLTGQVRTALARGYGALPELELRRRLRWDVYLLLLRAMLLVLLLGHGFLFVAVPLMALAMSYLEIWPERALGAVFGDPARLHEDTPVEPPVKRRRKR